MPAWREKRQGQLNAVVISETAGRRRLLQRILRLKTMQARQHAIGIVAAVLIIAAIPRAAASFANLEG